MWKFREILSAAFLLVLAVQTGAAQEFERRYLSASGALAGSPAETEALSRFVTIVSQAGFFDLALDAVREHLDRHPQDGRAHLLASRLYRNLGARDLAEEHAQRALQTGTLGAGEISRANHLLASVATPKDAPRAASQQFDPIATAAVSQHAARGPAHAEDRQMSPDEGVLRRIYGESAKATGRTEPAATQRNGPAPVNALVSTGSPFWSHLLGVEEAGAASPAETAESVPNVDLSLRYTFALY